jgi:hypothetical protein
VLHLCKGTTSITFHVKYERLKFMLSDYNECFYSDAENCEVQFFVLSVEEHNK